MFNSVHLDGENEGLQKPVENKKGEIIIANVSSYLQDSAIIYTYCNITFSVSCQTASTV